MEVVLTWSTYIEKGLDGGTVFDKLYTEQRMEAEEQFTLRRDDIPIKEKVSISTLYQMVDVINVSKKLYVFVSKVIVINSKILHLIQILILIILQMQIF